MLFFSALLLKIIPLYMNIFMGFLSGRLLDANRDTIARIIFFLIQPIVIFSGIIHTRLDFSVLLIPAITFSISTCLCLGFYKMSKPIWQDSSRNLMAFSAGSGNTGYFGLPVALLLFNEQGEGVYIMALLGITLYENSIGFYIFAKGSHTAAECLWKLIKLPTLYAFTGGLVINLLHVQIPELFTEFMGHIKGTYTVLGMMIIGLGLAGIKNFKLDFKFIGMTFLAKFVAWPLMILAFIALDVRWIGFFSSNIHNALMLISIVPLSVNTVILASLLKTQPEKAATAVICGIIFALVYVPVMAAYFIKE
jgi:malate permease and related proteins